MIFRPETAMAMARLLVRMPHSANTIQTMVYNDFGVRIPEQAIEQIRVEEAPAPIRRTSRQWSQPMEYSTTAHNSSMAQSSKLLLARICAKHPRVIKAAAADGRLAVWA